MKKKNPKAVIANSGAWHYMIEEAVKFYQESSLFTCPLESVEQGPTLLSQSIFITQQSCSTVAHALPQGQGHFRIVEGSHSQYRPPMHPFFDERDVERRECNKSQIPDTISNNISQEQRAVEEASPSREMLDLLRPRVVSYMICEILILP